MRRAETPRAQKQHISAVGAFVLGLHVCGNGHLAVSPFNCAIRTKNAAHAPKKYIGCTKSRSSQISGLVFSPVVQKFSHHCQCINRDHGRELETRNFHNVVHEQSQDIMDRAVYDDRFLFGTPLVHAKNTQICMN